MSHFIALCRVHQYIKNFFIFAPLLFSFQFTRESITLSLIAFAAFSLMASAVYIFNDLMDVEQDKLHPRKKYRPLAHGDVKSSLAVFYILGLMTLSIAVSFLLNENILWLLLTYLAINIAYSIKLKHTALIDIFLISIGFVLRVIVGAQAINVHLSMWLIIMTFLLALFLALSKRRDDVLLAREGCEARKNIDGYNLEFVNGGMLMLSAVIIVSYILYTISSDVIERLGTPYLYMTTVFVILGIMRYMQIAFVLEKTGSPTRALLQDRFLQIVIILWLLAFYFITHHAFIN